MDGNFSERIQRNMRMLAALEAKVAKLVSWITPPAGVKLQVESAYCGVRVSVEGREDLYVMAGIRNMAQKVQRVSVICPVGEYHWTFVPQEDGSPPLDEIVAAVAGQIGSLYEAAALPAGSSAQRFIALGRLIEHMKAPAYAEHLGDGKVRIWVEWQQDVALADLPAVMAAIEDGYAAAQAAAGHAETQQEEGE